MVNLLGGISVAALRQTAIQHLVTGASVDGLQLAAYARLSLSAIGSYMSVFSRPELWPPSSDSARLIGDASPMTEQ